MTECEQCGRKSTLFLCDTCTSDLRDMLKGLPRWLGFLHDASVGATRLGESARRSGDLTSPMPCNLSASKIYDQVSNMLTTMVRDICESRGIDYLEQFPAEIR